MTHESPRLSWSKELGILVAAIGILTSITTYVVTRTGQNAAQNSQQDTQIVDLERRMMNLENIVAANTKVIVRNEYQLQIFAKQHEKMIDNQEEMKKDVSSLADAVHSLNRMYKEAHPELKK